MFYCFILNDLTVFSQCLFIQCRTGELETVVEEDKQKAVQVERLKKEKGELISQLTAQESVIDGLKMERKIWGQELAEQGKIVGYFLLQKKWWCSVSYISKKHSSIVLIMTGSLDAFLIISSCKDDVQKYIFCGTWPDTGFVTTVVSQL